MVKKVLVIDDEQMMLDAVKTILEEMGHQVECFSSSAGGEKEEFQKYQPDLVFNVYSFMLPCYRTRAAVTCSLP